MRGLKKQRRIQVVMVATVALAVSAGLIGYAMRDGINFFRAPVDVVASPPPATETFRIGGLVEDGSLVRGQGETITFLVTDGGASVPVTYTGVLPDLFDEGQGMVGTGRLVDGVFEATEILARHDETYMPAEVIDALEEQGVYRHAEDEAGPES
ncbi:Cytochrome c-type biogenesis protein CcmE, heme chaperone [Roseibacterium elongatum DSM 19469]|uniref:Cytochrome c-type biogenesis protein CcmE n=1 Tax=Roseicyclus elongatus DSM 19469 TaxID=1294273 RepID=W8SRN3_9RHOB|nr:cytochrome c maturation protein CcmE [Roseibacterium elongatum]AHM05200.1 Cytochrome c-type biogenesis protein CcmE, heme chaperone [Roseibacterium elongatum DSM 19469]